MKKEKTIKDGKVLYISGYGDDPKETVVYALTMPVAISVCVDHNGEGTIEFYEKEEDGVNLPVCQTGFSPNTTPPSKILELSKDLCLEENIAKTVAGWISIYMRDGVFCTDSQKDTFVHNLDLRDIKDRLEKNLDDVYNRYRNRYN